MVFSSIEFLWFFLPLTLAAYLIVPPRARNALLVAASLVFYAWGAHALLFLFLASIAINYVAGRVLGHLREAGREQALRRVKWLAVGVNLGLLFTWKYAAFAVHQLDRVLKAAGLETVSTPRILLPIGISFFTFHGISYVLDVARGTSKPMRRVVDYAQYMAFFPQLIAGPIVRYHQIEDQIRTSPARGERLTDIADGFPRFALGLSKKVLIADQLAPVVNAIYGSGGRPNATTAWLGAMAFTLQIYFDFSGYSDMAIGMARMFGLRFPENFDRPYSAVSITDFWRRWHMTLSRWFRDYVYFPLGGSRGSTRTTVRNLLFVFFLTGAWHGAAWTFVLWGVYHGVLIVLERLTGIARMDDDRLAVPRRVVTLLLVACGLVVFRSTSLAQAGHVLSGMASLDFGSLTPVVHQATGAQSLLALGIGLASCALPRDFVLGRYVQGAWSGAPLLARVAVIAPLPWVAVALAAGSFSPFLYFQF